MVIDHDNFYTGRGGALKRTSAIRKAVADSRKRLCDVDRGTHEQVCVDGAFQSICDGGGGL